MFKVGSETEAKRLLVMTCPTNYNGEFVAVELAQEQTLDNLEAFSTHLDQMHDRLSPEECDCAKGGET